MSIAEVVREVVWSRFPESSLRRGATILAAALAGTFLALGLLVLAYGFSQGERIYPGVRVGTVDVGGLTTEQARAQVIESVDTLSTEAFVLRFEGHEVRLPIADLNPQWDVDAAVADAHAVGRSGNLWRDSGTWLRARLAGEQVLIPVTFDRAPIERTLAELATVAATPAIDATFSLDEQGRVQVTPERSGVGIDLGAAVAQITRRLMTGQAGTIELAPITVEPQLRAKDLQPLVPQVRDLVGSPIVLALEGEERWLIRPEDLIAMLAIERTERGLAVRLDRVRLERYLEQVADVVVRPVRDAQVQWNGARFVVIPAEPGAVLDVGATVEELLARLDRGERRIPVQARPGQPAVSTAMGEAASQVARDLVERGVVLEWPDGKEELRGGNLAPLLAFEPQRRGVEVTGLAVTLDRDRGRGLLEQLAGRIQRAPEDAVLRYYDGKVRVVESEQMGRELDIEASLDALERAIRTGSRTVPLAVREIEPKVTAAMASQIVIRERISSGATYYGDSAPNRRHNVELAVQRVNGALVPPGAVFSFNQTVGPINLENGYKVGYGIVATNGRVQTVPSVGGGVCQVSTTLFHAAFWGGFPIVERNWHLYWIPLYGQPPSGLIGLDATVDTDYGLDFKFRNTTSDWIAIVAWADGAWVHFEIWGTKPNWRVEVDDPVVTNVVKADPTPVFRESPDLAPGDQLVIERARDGFTVTIRRRVYEGDRLIDDWTLRSTYQPSQNVTLVGPQPSPTPTVSPTPVGEEGTPIAGEPTPVPPEPTMAPTPAP
ncbi:MAG: peptidoglycan binding domain-containing protein [Thermomicrobium sp.]|nr:peptidoglycan binding domain-containing protein [Thermomicrobium sp.]